MSIGKEVVDYHRRTILLAYNPNSIKNSQQLLEWASSNIIRPNLDHVYIFSVLPKQNFYPEVDNFWTLGLIGYSTHYYSNTTHEIEYQNYIKHENEFTKRQLQSISLELTAKNITSNIIINRGNVREELLNICDSIKPDMVLIGSSSSKSKSKLRKFLNRSNLSYIRDHLKNIQVLSNADYDKKFIMKNIKKHNSEPKKRIHRVIQEAMKQIKPKSCDTADIIKPTVPNKNYHKLED